MDIKERYFDWLYSIIDDGQIHYKKLCQALDSRDFIYYIPLDANRYDDGIDLRYHFGRCCGVSDARIAYELDNRQCSVFEMMVALANRCEEDITFDPDVGNRACEWFHEMLESLDLASMTDNVGVDERYFNIVIDRFINRDYEPNGKGGLFTLKNCTRDLRDVEIWYQAMWYLTSKEDFNI